jgi:hypothetical protein
LARHTIKDGEAATIRKKIVAFARSARITLRGRPAGWQELDSVTTLLQESTDESIEDQQTQDQMNQPAPTSSKKLNQKALVKMLAAKLHGSIPKYHLDRPEKFANALVKELDDKISAVPRPARHAKLDALAAELFRHDPNRGKALEKAAMRFFLGQVVDRTTELAGACSGKK